MYVDDLVAGRERINQFKKLKSDSISLFRPKEFKLHKRDSNETILETNDSCITTELHFAKQQLGTKVNKTRILGILWDEQNNKEKQISYIDIHFFGDASLTGVCTVAYKVLNHQNVFSQSLITSKSRLARKILSLPRIKFEAAHMTANLKEYVKTCFNKLSVRKIYAWLDITALLYWLKNKEETKYLLVIRCLKSKEKVPSMEICPYERKSC